MRRRIRKRRLRKKLRVGEFQELGFDVTYTSKPELTESDRDKLLDAFIEFAIEANELAAGGGGITSMDFFVASSKSRGSATEAHRQAVETWLNSRTDIDSFKVGDFRDAWHDNP